jgi:hypothetical protein
MFRRISLAASIIGVALGAVILASNAVQAQSSELTEDQERRISVNCLSIQNSLSQLHASDALLRVNRGQVYESMATKLMDRFNARLTSNSLDAKAMTTVTGNYRTALATFRTDYISYEQKLSDTMRIDCTEEPSQFHASVLRTRELRAKVHEDVIRLHRYIDDYRSSVGDFLINYERVSE